jgi:hypothetical protein
MKQRREGLLLLKVGGEPCTQQFSSEIPNIPLKKARAEFESHCPHSPKTPPTPESSSHSFTHS